MSKDQSEAKRRKLYAFALSEIRRAKKMLRKGRGLEKCEHPADAVKWNPNVGVTQCFRCGQVMPDDD